MNVLDKIIAIIISVFLLFGFALMVITQQQDHTVQEYVDLKTTAFVDQVRNNGYLSKRMYMDFLESLDHTGNLYTVKMTSEHTNYLPVYDDDGNFQNDYVISYSKDYEQDIIDCIMAGDNYIFSEGDYFYVEITSKNQTLGSKVLYYFTGIGPVKNSIHTYYGGSIRNEAL